MPFVLGAAFEIVDRIGRVGESLLPGFIFDPKKVSKSAVNLVLPVERQILLDVRLRAT
jgi:hypothetical protein